MQSGVSKGSEQGEAEIERSKQLSNPPTLSAVVVCVLCQPFFAHCFCVLLVALRCGGGNENEQ